MKIILINQAETAMKWEAEYDAAGFEDAVAAEIISPALPVSVKKGDAAAYRIYTDTSPASADTAAMLFEYAEAPTATPLLDDVPLRAFRAGEKVHPLRLWTGLGIAQWLLGNGRQAESRADTARRARRFVEQLEAEDRDCIVICRGLLLLTLKTVLRRRGYCVEGGSLRPKPMERVRAVKQSLHCGGCHHNCLLSEAKCEIGKNKTIERAQAAKHKNKSKEREGT